MVLTKIYLENFTVFDKIEMKFTPNINVFIGENGTGKTHVMKLLYSACQAAQIQTTAVDFPQKIVRVFRPDDFNIGRLVGRSVGNRSARVHVSSNHSTIKVAFEGRAKRWEAKVTGKQIWEKSFVGVTSTFIPAKEILSNSRNLVQAIDKGNVDFDDTYKDLISAASLNLSVGRNTVQQVDLLKLLQDITGGQVKYENEEFYLKHDQSKLEFQLIAEGMRKIALLWQLIKNGTLGNGTILFWDEPEANVNPKHIPTLVNILMTLQKNGIQIFIATHDYVLAKYLELRGESRDSVCFYSLYKTKETIESESNRTFRNLEHNAIADAYNTLLDEVFVEETKV
jgi:ABC-type ATPase involved in cell division